MSVRKECYVENMSAAQLVESLNQQYNKLVFYTIYGLTGDWEESQDLTQDTFHQALRAIDAARTARSSQFHAKAWLLRIALNTVRMQRRRRALFRFIPFSRLQEGQSLEEENTTLLKQAAPVQPAGYGISDAEDPAELIAEQDMVRRTMARLPETLRTCLLLSIIGGLSTGEIADMLALKEAAVRQRLVRARKQFQQEYARESSEEILVRETRPEERMQHTMNEHADLHNIPDRTERLKLSSLSPSAFS